MTLLALHSEEVKKSSDRTSFELTDQFQQERLNNHASPKLSSIGSTSAAPTLSKLTTKVLLLNFLLGTALRNFGRSNRRYAPKL
jgi:hypothetical protein